MWVNMFLFEIVKIPKTININPTINSAPTKKSLCIFNDKPAITNPTKMMLDVCPIPHTAPLNEDTILNCFNANFFEPFLFLINSRVEIALM